MVEETCFIGGRMKIGFCLTILPPCLNVLGEGKAKPEIVIMDIPDDKLPKLVQDALDDSKDYIYINNIVRVRE